MALDRRLPLALALAALLLAGCGGKSTSATTGAQVEGAEAGTTDASGCRDVAEPAPKPDGDRRRPTQKLSPSKTYDVVVTTNCGSFTIRIDQKSAPATGASFVSLARTGFFDDTVFHRIVPGFVIQGGDPTGRGTGGPGYSTVDPPKADARYVKGVVAMAKTAAEPAGTAGSQFFVVTAQDAGLPPEYAILGKVVAGE